MPAIPVRDREAAATSDAEFFALVCSDEDLLRAEFDAIIADEWPDPPPPERGRGDTVERPTRAVRRRRPIGSRAQRTDRARHPGFDEWVRQRSPPVRQERN
jgi:hypothetical protein